MWTKWFVLAACAVITQSFPRSVEEPQVPVDQSTTPTQYYVLQDNGDFTYGYNTGDGTYESAVKMGSDDLTGFYGYVNTFGKNVRLDYTAGVRGFVPRSSLLPVEPQVDVAAIRSAVSESAAGASGVITKSYSSRGESADYSPNVVGKEFFVADDGQTQKILFKDEFGNGFVVEDDSTPDYTAKVGGFVPKSSLLLVEPQVDAAAVQTAISESEAGASGVITKSAAPSRPIEEIDDRPANILDESYSSRGESADSSPNVEGQELFVADVGSDEQILSKAESGAGYAAEEDSTPDDTAEFGGFVPKSSLLLVEPQVDAAAVQTAVSESAAGASGVITKSSAPSRPIEETDVRPANILDESYSSRGESADSSPKVVGKEFFVADDGQNQKILFKDEFGNGFVVEDDLVPVALAAPASPASRSVFASTSNAHQASAASVSSSEQTITPRGDSSLSFSFQKPDSSREESAESVLNIKGRSLFFANDEIRRKMNYIAGTDTGFVAEGAHLSAAPEKAGVSASGSTGSESSSFSSSSSSSSSSDIALDASFSSEQDAVDSSREERADSNINVKKPDSLDADDDVTGTFQYAAGSGTEFKVEGAQLPVPVSSTSSRAFSGSTGNQLKYPDESLPGAVQTSGSTLGSSEVASFRERGVLGDITFESNSGDDASYSFSYTNADTFRSESADNDLNVKGVYSFIADDGIERHIRYRAGSGIGFIAEGTHLPVPVLETASGAR